jgi:hypothetical protein
MLTDEIIVEAMLVELSEKLGEYSFSKVDVIRKRTYALARWSRQGIHFEAHVYSDGEIVLHEEVGCERSISIRSHIVLQDATKEMFSEMFSFMRRIYNNDYDSNKPGEAAWQRVRSVPSYTQDDSSQTPGCRPYHQDRDERFQQVPESATVHDSEHDKGNDSGSGAGADARQPIG